MEERRILAFERPDLLKEWDFEKNFLICAPDEITIGNRKKVWWICKTCGEKWEASISNRTYRNSGCPYCSGRLVIKGKRDLLSTFPELCEEWDYYKNPIKPDDVSKGSSRKVWWICKTCNGEWETTIEQRTNRGYNCPYCAGKKLLKGFNDLKTLSPKIADEWDYEKNDKTPSDFLNGSGIAVWWKCKKCNYSWKMPITARTYANQGCPYCGHNAVWVGHNDLLTTDPELCEEWDYERNDGKSPEQYSVGSHAKVWWKCRKCNYEWKATIKDRKTRDCPHCAGKTVWEGHNDIATTDPWVLEEWDYGKNKVLPTEVSRGSGKKAWWKCKTCHGEWEETVNNRVIGKYGCPYCSGRRVLKGYNDLATKYPYLVEEWDFANNKLTPYEVTSKSSKKAWWICQVCGNKYYKLISDRTNGSGCPKCSKDSRSSFPEQIVFYYVKEAYPQAKNGYKPKWLLGKEIDIYIPKIKVAIEYDGEYWHATTNKDLEKNELIKEHHITLFRIREPNAPTLDDGTEVIVTADSKYDGSHVISAINHLFFRLKQIDNTLVIPKMDIGRDRNKIISQYVVSKKSKSLEAKQPLLAKEWDYEKNGELLPNHITAGTSHKVWWKCPECGNSWEATPKDRMNGSGCPYCSGRKISSGLNDFATLQPEIAFEWDYEKNEILPSQIGVGDTRKFWWKCSGCGKNWQTTVASRKRPYCPTCNYHNMGKNRHLIVGKTDLATVHPELVKDWMYERNSWTDPSKETAQSHVKVWWKCNICGNEWESTIGDRSSGHGCPECAKQKRVAWKKIPVKGKSFGDLFPELIDEWHPLKNNGKTPFDYRPYSSARVWWICKKCGREWQTSISNRASGAGCRSCAHKKTE